MSGYVYILASQQKGTLYIGSTSNLVKRVWQHKQKSVEGFTSKYNVSKLVYYEVYQRVVDMAQRKRRLKEWKRSWKIELIEKQNPNWIDLFDEIAG
jgi:putative endonuclease